MADTKKKNWWRIVGNILLWIFIIYILFNLFLPEEYNDTELNDKVSGLELEVSELKSQVTCLNNYIYNLQTALKKDPDYVTGKDVAGAISIYFPEPNCNY